MATIIPHRSGDENPKLQMIGIMGKMQSGKSTIADIIQTHCDKVTHIQPFSKPLKFLARNLGWDGSKNEKGRRFLQVLGSEICRKLIDEDYWVKLFDQAIRTPEFSNPELMFDPHIQIYNELRICDFDLPFVRTHLVHLIRSLGDLMCPSDPVEAPELVIVDDVRFLNEIHCLKKYYSNFIMVTRSGYEGNSHISESLSKSDAPASTVFVHNKDLKDLVHFVKEYIGERII